MKQVILCNYVFVCCRYQFRCDEESKPDSRRKVARSASFVSSLPKEVYEVDEKGKQDEQVCNWITESLQSSFRAWGSDPTFVIELLKGFFFKGNNCQPNINLYKYLLFI